MGILHLAKNLEFALREKRKILNLAKIFRYTVVSCDVISHGQPGSSILQHGFTRCTVKNTSHWT